MRIIILFGIIMLFCIIMLSGCSPQKWCEVNQPMFNTSLDDERVAYCYGEGWSEYCKISYPHHCPDKQLLKLTDQAKEEED